MPIQLFYFVFNFNLLYNYQLIILSFLHPLQIYLAKSHKIIFLLGFIQCADRYLHPLYDLMKKALLQSEYLYADETRIQVIDEPDQKGSTQNWMWGYLTAEYSGSPQMVLFQYERTRAGYHPVEFLRDQFD